MSLLIGLPLKLFAILFALVRIALPVLLILLVIWLLRRRKGQACAAEPPRQEKEPTFDGPVYTVDYQEVDDREEKA